MAAAFFVPLPEVLIDARSLATIARMTDATDNRQPIEHDGELYFPVPGDPVAYVTESACVGYFKKSGQFFKAKPWMDSHHKVMRVICPIDGKSRHLFVHRLMWQAFRGEIPAGCWPAPIDGNPRRVAIDNLHLKSRQEVCGGTRSGRAKLSHRQVLEIRSHPELTLSQISERYGISMSVAGNVKRGDSYNEVQLPSCGPASDALKDRVRGMMSDVGIHDRVSQAIVDHMDARGHVIISKRAMVSRYGISTPTIHRHFDRAVRNKLVQKTGWQACRVPIGMTDDEWQDHLDSLQVNQYQREILIVRVRRSLAIYPELPPSLADEIAREVDADGVFRVAAIRDAAYSDAWHARIRNTLKNDGVIERINVKLWRFTDLPPRNPKSVDPMTDAAALAKADRAADHGIETYREVISLISTGYCGITEIASDTGVSATIVEKIDRVLKVPVVLRTLLANGGIKNADQIFSIPPDAARALAEYARADHTDIHASKR